MRDGRLFENTDRRGDEYRYFSRSGFDNIMIVTIIILTKEVIGGTFQMNLRKKNHLCLMEM